MSPGQTFNRRAATVEPIPPAKIEELLVQFDEMEALADALTPPPRPEELPAKR